MCVTEQPHALGPNSINGKCHSSALHQGSAGWPFQQGKKRGTRGYHSMGCMTCSAPPCFAAAWTCVCGSKDSKRQSCCPIYKPGANLTAFYFFWCCCQRELIQIMFQVTIQHWAWGRVLKSCPPPPCQTAECFINLKQRPPTQHPGCIQVLSCSLGKGRNISVRSEKDQANTLHSALMTFATFCKARLQTCFLIASGSNPDWQRIIQQLSFLWNAVITP